MPPKKPVSKITGKTRLQQQGRFLARGLPGAVAAAYPGFIDPMLPELRTVVPAGEKWLFELKLDGYRAQAHLVDGNATVFTRRGFDWSGKFEPVTIETAALPARSVILDGELVAIDPDGRVNFSALEADLGAGRMDRLVFYAFDLLYHDGVDLRGVLLIERKKALAELLDEAGCHRILYTEHFESAGAQLFEKVCGMQMEGIVCKQKQSKYASGRTDIWLKVKCTKRDDFPVIGYIPDAGGGIAALYVGKWEGETLRYAGKVGTGFSGKTGRQLRKSLEKIRAIVSPVDGLDKPKASWVEPFIRARVQYNDITDDGLLRHASFICVGNC
ncbi:MAG TPA: non-homologous end-joining DNA ligase [Patescibacteria group bacterium]|nr:non-homologous end-joining DNA ligase [Patescibacteria group bacterium]